jgi:DNA-binding GntR family transcriptional regulator
MLSAKGFGPLPETPQLGTRVYHAVVESIVGGNMEFGSPLRPDVIARQLDVSTTPVREALHRLEGDGLAVKIPNRGWFVREFTSSQIRELYEMRATLECFGVRLACQRITPGELSALDALQQAGEAGLLAGDMERYRIYNRDLHAAIMGAARHGCLTTVMGQLRLQSELLMAKTIRISGRPIRAIEEHRRILDATTRRDSDAAAALMEQHILSAVEDIVRWGREPSDLTPDRRAHL